MQLKVRLRAVPLSELLPADVAAEWPELELPMDGYEAVAADLGDLDRCMAIVAPVFGVSMASEGGVLGAGNEPSEYQGVAKGVADRLGARRSVLGPNAAAPRPRILRPVPLGSTERPDLGLVLALAPVDDPEGPFAGLVDISLWPNDGRVRAPGANSKPGVPSRPYILNLCVDPTFRRRGLARALMSLSERVIRDVWGDSAIYLHVEDDKVPANALYEAMNYEPMKYVYDEEFPYTKDEAKVLRNVTWRCKYLEPPSPNSPALTGSILRMEEEAREREMAERKAWEEEQGIVDDEEEEDEEDIEKDDDDNGTSKDTASGVPDDGEDYSWVTSLIR